MNLTTFKEACDNLLSGLDPAVRENFSRTYEKRIKAYSNTEVIPTIEIAQIVQGFFWSAWQAYKEYSKPCMEEEKTRSNKRAGRLAIDALEALYAYKKELYEWAEENDAEAAKASDYHYKRLKAIWNYWRSFDYAFFEDPIVDGEPHHKEIPDIIRDMRAIAIYAK